MRNSNRLENQTRQVSIETGVNAYAEGSCLIKFGATHVLCTASLEEKVPQFLRNKGRGWITANYNMLARATHIRNSNDPSKPNGRNIEITRLIGRALRSCVDLKKLGERQIIIDCDVLQADGSTRCAAITGGMVALELAIEKILGRNFVKSDLLINQICAVSCGILNNKVLVDLDYEEDSSCEVDCNFVLNKNLNLIEIQGTAENGEMNFNQVAQMFNYASDAAAEIFKIQKEAVKNA
jgi:ribonuclease PH